MTSQTLGNIGPRVAGTPGRMQSGDYLPPTSCDSVRRHAIQDFRLRCAAAFPLVRRVSSGGNSVGGSRLSVAIRRGTVTGPLVIAGIGKPEEFPAGGMHGGIAVSSAAN